VNEDDSILEILLWLTLSDIREDKDLGNVVDDREPIKLFDISK
jgi:hypothetical protein